MKKLLVALAICSLVVFALVTTVMADNGPHGSFAADTDACAGCHRVHSAKYGSNALLVADPEALCMNCHNGAGAGTNVEFGVYSLANSGVANEGTDGGPLLGGGFEYALMATKWSGKVTADPSFNATSRATTSHHNLGTSGTVWGSGANNSTPGLYVLECTSCHDPHGTAGWDVTTTPDTRVATYRLLRWQPQGSGGYTPPGSVNWAGGAFPTNDANTPVSGWLITDTIPLGQEWYTIGTTGAFAVGDYSAPSSAGEVYNVKNPLAPAGTSYMPAARNMSFFCAQCHDRYLNNSRLRNHTDASLRCGAPVAGVVVNGLTLPVYPDADGVAPWIHPVDPVTCIPVTNSAGVLTGWGDNAPSGDLTYMFRHTSGDLRASADGTVAMDQRKTLGRSCMACHVAHGTTADMTTLAGNATLAKGSSVLLRMDNRSICLRCHTGDVNFTVGP